MVNGEQTVCPQRRRQRGQRGADPLTAESKGVAEGSGRSRKPGHTKPGHSQTRSYSVQLRSLQLRSHHRTDVCASIWFLAFRINLAFLRCTLISTGTQRMPLTPLLSLLRAALQLMNAATHLSTDLSSDWQLPDSDSSGLMKASSS